MIAAAPNVCVTERGTFVATQLNKSSVPTSGATVVNHVVGQSPDANMMMNRMFSVVRGGETSVPMTLSPASVLVNVSRAQRIPQIAHIHPSVINEKSHQNANASNQILIKPRQNANVPNANVNNTNQNTARLNQNAPSSYQNVNRSDSNTKRTSNSTVVHDKNTNVSSQSAVKKFSLNVSGRMGVVTTAVRSGMFAREKLPPAGTSRDKTHLMSCEGGYSVKIDENNLETKSGSRTTTTSIADLRAHQSNITPEITRNQSVIQSHTPEVSSVASEASPTYTEHITMSLGRETNKNETENSETIKYHHDDVAITKRPGGTWMYRKRKKKKVRFTYVKGKKNKKKQENFEENGEDFEQEFADGEQKRLGIKRRHSDRESSLFLSKNTKFLGLIS